MTPDSRSARSYSVWPDILPESMDIFFQAVGWSSRCPLGMIYILHLNVSRHNEVYRAPGDYGNQGSAENPQMRSSWGFIRNVVGICSYILIFSPLSKTDK